MNVENYLFKTIDNMQESFIDYCNNVKIQREGDHRNYILRNGSIGICSEKNIFDIKKDIMGVNPYLRTKLTSSICGTHPYVWIFLDLYGELTRCNTELRNKFIEIFYGCFAHSLEPKGKIINFSLKCDLKYLKKRNDFNQCFAQDVLLTCKKYSDVNYVVTVY